jgi:2-polyprenyl-6-hydroxyphenyl methylase / 3-demethylubiquinone-9 3-methyltransferase
VTGLDLASELLQVGKLHSLESGVAVDYRLESAEQHAGDHAGTYDMATCMEMLEHVPDPRSVVTSLAAMVRPGGHVFVSTINRTPRAYLHAVVGAEYVLRLLPRGTHTYDKFIRPSELAGWGKAAGLETLDVAGIDYDPFARTARLTGDARVNYLVHFHKPAPDGARA